MPMPYAASHNLAAEKPRPDDKVIGKMHNNCAKRVEFGPGRPGLDEFWPSLTGSHDD
jgi:hypothetical protein